MIKWLMIFMLLFSNVAYADTGVGRKPTVTTATLPDTSTEVTVDLSTEYRPITQLQIKCRTSVAIRISFTEGGTSDDYFTLPADQTYFDNELNWKGKIYLKSGSGSVTAEVMYWQ